jgi:hypothetical protein
MNKIYFIILFLTLLAVWSDANDGSKNKKKKSIADMTDAEIDKIYQEWEVKYCY